ncbi:990_t:CDS:2, partial [Gigaspora margarita]
MLFGNFILPTPSPISSRVDLKILKIIQNEFNESKEIYESALVEMNVDADFTPLFTFNTHSIFVSLIVEYETPTHVWLMSCNQIALWSFIIRNRTSAVLQIHQEMNTFNDITSSFKGVNGTYMMEWNIIPRLGVLRHGRKIIRYPPEVLIKHDQTPITQPRVKADLNSTTLTISGPLGTHSMPLKPYIRLKFYESKIPYVKPEDRKPITNEDDFIDESDFDKKLSISVQHPENKEQKTMWGTTRALIANYIRGVSEGYKVSLKFVGVGYRASLESDGKLYLEVGYVNPVVMEIPPDIKCIVPAPTKIILSGTDKQLVYRFAAQIREHRKPEPYNQKATVLTVLVAGLRITVQDSIDLTFNPEFQLSNLQNEEKRLIQTSSSTAEWMTEEQVLGLIRNKIKFMDITDYRSLGTKYKTFKKHGKFHCYSLRKFPVSPAFQDEVMPLINNLTTKYMRKNLEKFTSFRNRYYKSKYGAESSQWLYDQVVSIVKNANYSDAILSVKQFPHRWEQKSIIARFAGSDEDKSNEVVIVGAHQDSVNMWMPSFGRSPG